MDDRLNRSQVLDHRATHSPDQAAPDSADQSRPGLQCVDLYQCVESCGDDACVEQQCASRADSDTIAKLNALYQCAQACTDQQSCESQCAAQLSACQQDA